MPWQKGSPSVQGLVLSSEPACQTRCLPRAAVPSVLMGPAQGSSADAGLRGLSALCSTGALLTWVLWRQAHCLTKTSRMSLIGINHKRQVSHERLNVPITRPVQKGGQTLKAKENGWQGLFFLNQAPGNAFLMGSPGVDSGAHQELVIIGPVPCRHAVGSAVTRTPVPWARSGVTQTCCPPRGAAALSPRPSSKSAVAPSNGSMFRLVLE